MAPWILFLFMGVFDFGFYAYAAISVANAARVGVLYTSGDPLTADDARRACPYVVQELRMLPNVGNLTCTCISNSDCSAGPLRVRAFRFATGADGSPSSAVQVDYSSPNFFPVPGLMGQMNFSRAAEMRL